MQLALVWPSVFCYHAVSRYHQEALLACWVVDIAHLIAATLVSGWVSRVMSGALAGSTRTAAYQYWIPSLWRRRLSAHATLLCDGRRNSKLQLRVARLDSFVCWVVCAPQPRAYDCHEWLGGRAYPWTKRSPPRCASALVHSAGISRPLRRLALVA